MLNCNAGYLLMFRWLSKERVAVVVVPSPPLETPPTSPPPPPPPPPETPPSFVNSNHYSQMRTDRGTLWTPPQPQPPPPLQCHRPFTSFNPQPCSTFGPRPGSGQSSSIKPHQNNRLMMMGPNPCFQMQPPIGGAHSHFEQGMVPLPMRPPPPPPSLMQPPIGAHSQFEQGMMSLPMRPHTSRTSTTSSNADTNWCAFTLRMGNDAVTYETISTTTSSRSVVPASIWPYFPPAQMMNHGFLNNGFRPLDLGNFPPWQITVDVAGGETRYINIPNSEGNHVIGLPLGLDVPQSMRNVITDIVRELARCQQDAARFWQDANCFYCELEELRFLMAGNMVVSQDLMAPVSPTKKRKMIPGESVSSEAKALQIHKPEYLPMSIRSCGDRSSTVPTSTVFPVQASVTNEDDIPITSVKCSQGKFINKEILLYCSEVQAEMVKSLEFVEHVRESVEATMTSSSTMCQTLEATMTSSPTMCQTEGFELVQNFDIPKEYENSYKNIIKKYGHMATRKVTKSNIDKLHLVTRYI